MQGPIEDYIWESHLKCAHVILGSRIFQSQQTARSPAERRSGRWFLLEIEELAGLSQHLEPWRRDVYAPLIIEVSIRPWDTSKVMPGEGSYNPAPQAAGSSSGATAGSSMLLERWTLCFSPGVNSNSNSRAAVDTAAVYKRLILLIRSLYSYVRVLPAYRLYRACKRHGGELFNTSYSLSTTADPSMLPLQQWAPQQYQQPLSSGRGAAAGQAGSSSINSSSTSGGRMCQFAFTPVETPGAAFSIHVEYQPATTVHILEQTTVPVSMPRIISDYVDSPYARSAPSAADHSPSSKQAVGRTGSRLSGPDGPVALLRSSQVHHTPLVRHSWSSRDVSGPTVVQRGFNPAAISSSSSSTHQQHQMLLQPRTSSQGSSGLGGLPMSPARGCQSPVFGATGGSSSWGRPPLPHTASLHAAAHSGAAQGLTAAGSGFSSSLPSGYSGLSGPGLPPASPGTPSGGVRSALVRSSSLSAAAAIGAGMQLAAHQAAVLPTQQHTSSRLSTSPTVLQQPRHVQQHPRPPVQPLSPRSTQQGFHVKATPANSTSSTTEDDPALGGHGSSSRLDSSSGTAAAAAAAGDAPASVSPEAGAGGVSTSVSEQQQQQQQPGAAADSASGPAAVGPLAVQAMSAGTPAGPEGAQGLSPGEGVDVTGSTRGVSAPVMIPYKAKGMRARSVSDLAKLDAEAVVAAARRTSLSAQQDQQQQQQQQDEGDSGAASSAWQQQQQQQQEPQHCGGLGMAQASAGVPGDAATHGLTVGTVKVTAGAVVSSGVKGSSSSGLLKVHQHHLQQQHRQQQQLVQAPSSAPAAPRGMLGQLLSAGSGPTSPAFSPRGAAAHRAGSSRVVAAALAAAAAATTTRESGGSVHPSAAVPAEEHDGNDSDSSSGTSSAADGIISSTPTPKGAIIIRPNPLGHMQHTPTAGSLGAGAITVNSTSPGGSSSCGSQPNSLGSRVLGRHAQRALAGQGFVGPGSGPYHTGFGVQPSTPTAPHSYLGSSPQLPFAFTPSAASLGTSLMSLADAQRQLLPASGMTGANNSLKTLGAPLSRPGSAAAAAAAAAGSAAVGVGPAAAPGTGTEQAPSHTAAAAGCAAETGSPAAGRSGGPSSAAPLGIGTPSPPLLYPPASGMTSAGQVSFIRDISGLATIRRPSWSSRSSSFDIAAVGSATLPHHLSMSPGMTDLLDVNLMMGYSSSHGSSVPGNPLLRPQAVGSSSNAAGAAGTNPAAPAAVYPWTLGPQQQQQQGHPQQPGAGIQEHQLPQQPQARQTSLLAAAEGSQSASEPSGPVAVGADGNTSGGAQDVVSVGGHAAGGDAGPSSAAPAAAAAGVEEALGCSTGHEESESDVLPFVLDAEPTAQHHMLHQHGGGVQLPAAAVGAGGHGAYAAVVGLPGPAGGPAGRGCAPSGATAESDAAVAKDVAVGAFLKLVQDAAGASVGRLDRRQAIWQQQQQQVQGGVGHVAAAGGVGVEAAGVAEGCGPPVCVGDAVQQVQDLAAQLQQLLFPESCGAV